jgi:hypothetical protein
VRSVRNPQGAGVLSAITAHRARRNSLATISAALSLSAAVFISGARAAGDQDVDSTAIDSTGEYGDTSASGSLPSGGPAPGGLTIEGLLYGREDLASVPFTAVGGTAGASYVEFRSDDLEGDDYVPGVRVSLQATIFDQPIELSGFFLVPFGLEATKLGLSVARPANQGGGFVPDTDTIYDDAPGISSVNSDSIYGLSIHHETKLFGAEANFVRAFGVPGLSIGARAINFGEVLSSSTMDTANSVPGIGTETLRDHVAIRTDNRLVGLQVGLQHMFDVGAGIRIGGSIKGGLYSNFVDRNRTFVSENRPDLRSFESTDHENVFAQGVEINPRFEFKLAEGTYLTAAGQFLWLNNVSTALPHYASIEDFTANHDVLADDDVYFYGGSLGLTVQLDQSSPVSNSLTDFAIGAPGSSSGEDIDERMAELEATTARKGNSNVSLSVSGWINRMVMFWDDGAKQDAYVVDNVASRSRINFEGAAKIARGWSAGYYVSLGLDDQASNDVDQLVSVGEQQIELRHSAWWLRSSLLGTVTLGHTSTATDNIILKDVGGIMPGAANIATIGGSLMLRHADWYEQGDGALVRSTSGTVNTTLNDISGGGSVDTLRRDVVRYDAPRWSSQWGNVDVSAAWGEDDFYDVAVEHGINYNDFKFRFGAGYLRDTTEGRVVAGHPEYFRDRREYKGSASILHIPTGLFATAAYVHRTFHGLEEYNAAGTPGAIYGENTAGLVTPDGTNRPPLDYLYTAFGLRRQYWSIGDTSIYGEYAEVSDAITGLREADLAEVTDSSLMMLGGAINQDIDDAGMDVYAGFRVFKLDTAGVQNRSSTGVTGPSPVPLTDLLIGYAGTRIKF